jgi:hypothetical protein
MYDLTALTIDSSQTTNSNSQNPFTSNSNSNSTTDSKSQSTSLTADNKANIPVGRSNIDMYQKRHEDGEDLAMGHSTGDRAEKIKKELDKWNKEWKEMQ